MSDNKTKVISEIKKFLDGSDNENKYIVNVETNYDDNLGTCIIHKPNSQSVEVKKIKYTPFLYIKDFKKHNINFWKNDKELQRAKMVEYGIKFKKLKTGNQPRLRDGFCYKVTSTKSFGAIQDFFEKGGVKQYEKKRGYNGKFEKTVKGDFIYPNRHLFYNVKTNDQFFISTGIRLFKGYEEYKDIHRLTFDIETTGLRYNLSRVFAIGVRDNKGFETILKVDRQDNDDDERKLIQDFFNTIDYVKPAIIQGYNSEMFDFEFILGRAKLLNVDLYKLKTTFDSNHSIKRRGNSSVKIGNTTEKYTATNMWGYSVIDINHASKKTAAINTDVKNTRLKYICQFEGIAKENRMYIDGSDGNISRYWEEDKVFIINPSNNEYLQIPDAWQSTSEELYELQGLKLNNTVSDDIYNTEKRRILTNNKEFINWLIDQKEKYDDYQFIRGKNILNQYLLDDLWETEQVDELYNQSTFLLSKLVPTTFQRVATMGNASVWNLLMTTWSYENDLAIPDSDVSENFGGGLTRCYRKGYYKRVVKIDFASLYPMIQLTWDVFPMFDITGVIKKMLTYMTTTRNIYKKLANADPLNDDEVILLEEIDHETYVKFINNEILDSERSMFKVKQLPIKIINNSLFGALGSGVAFNWSDNFSAAKITSIGRIQLRKAVEYFRRFGLEPLLAVTDGVNFGIPDYTTIRVTNGNIEYDQPEGLIEDMWKFGDSVGVAALIDKFNDEEMIKPFMSVDNDGEFISCFNLSRINYALLQEKKDKKTGKVKEKVKLTGNTIKSKTMPEYIEDFINKGFELLLQGKGDEFVEYYYEYAENIFHKRIPLKKIASKSKIKEKIDDYINRGVDKNGREKGKKAHMELLMMERDDIARKTFEEYKTTILKAEDLDNEYTIDQIRVMTKDYVPPEAALDSMVYIINTGLKKSHGSSNWIKDENDPTKKRFCSELITAKELEENPDLLGNYNVDKYFDSFNKRAKILIDGFEPEIAKRIVAKIKIKKSKDQNNKTVEKKSFEREYFTNEEMKIKSFEADPFDESMEIEKKEVKFWNRYGANPYLIWDGIKLPEGEILHNEIYDFKLKIVSEKMIAHGKKPPKSIDDKYEKGDYVLLKNGSDYSLGYYNGVHIEVVRENMDLPKCDLEIEIERQEKEERELIIKKKEEAKLEKRKEILNKKIKDREQKLFFFKKFSKLHEIPTTFSMEEFFEAIPNGLEMFEEYVLSIDDELEYLGVME